LASFGFDERYAMFDVTPVENQFILELLPEAKGEFVKVYLYGLMKCYHPEIDTDLDQMAADLQMTREEIEQAYRYWERRHIVRRISDHPPQWRYISNIQKSLSGDTDSDPEFESFSNAIYEAFDNDRRLHGSEVAACFEWHEELGLPTEVIIMLLKHMIALRGKQFKIRDAEKAAVEMSREKVQTIEDAEEFLARDRVVADGARRVLRKMGKKYSPSEAQTAMYRKWIREWGFTPEAVDAALAQTAGGDPSMGYLDSILNRIRESNGGGGVDRVADDQKQREALKQILREFGRDVVSEDTLRIYREMAALYPQPILRTAAKECRGAGRRLEDVLELVRSWKNRGLETEADIQKHLDAFHEQTALLVELKALLGTEGTADSRLRRQAVNRWTNEWGQSRELILKAAEYAGSARDPMGYLNAILAEYHRKGIRTPEEAEKEHQNLRKSREAEGNKAVSAQQYEQRDYRDKEQEAFNRLLRMNGGSVEDA